MVAVVVRALLLLGCLPLLHPPGVCACRAWALVLPCLDHDAERPRPAADAPDPAAVSAPLAVAAAGVGPAPVTASRLRPPAARPSAPPLYPPHCAPIC